MTEQMPSIRNQTGTISRSRLLKRCLLLGKKCERTDKQSQNIRYDAVEAFVLIAVGMKSRDTRSERQEFLISPSLLSHKIRIRVAARIREI